MQKEYILNKSSIYIIQLKLSLNYPLNQMIF